MKHQYLLSLLFLCAPLLETIAQPVVINEQYELTGFLAPAVAISSIAGQRAVSIGGCAALVVNHATVVGIEGFGLLPGVHGHDGAAGEQSNLRMLYTGVIAEHIGAYDRPLHWVLRGTLGWGSARYEYTAPDSEGRSAALEAAGQAGGNPDDWEAFLLFEPGIGAEYSISGSVRLELAAKYRFMTGMTLTGLERRNTEGVVIQTTLKLGSF